MTQTTLRLEGTSPMTQTAVEILLVEDNPNDVELTLHSLRSSNLSNQIEVVRDGAEALEFIFCTGRYANRSIENGPKVILLDLKLPLINGLEVLQRIRSDPRTSMLPVVVLTSSREERDIVDSYQLGVNSYIVKPVDFETVQSGCAASGVLLAAAQRAPLVMEVLSGKITMFAPLRVLILEDSLSDTELMLHELRQAGLELDWQRWKLSQTILPNWMRSGM